MARHIPSFEPVNYRLHLEPNLGSFRFYGTAQILLNASEPVGEMALNVLEIAVWRCQVLIDDAFVDCPFLVDPRDQTIQFAFPQEMEGEITIRFEFEGHINDGMVGFYRSRYATHDGEGYIAVTQFQENDARRAFPCFDHPDKKATFDVDMVIDEAHVAISNGAVESEERTGNGKKRVRFQQTPKMSTYLLFFGVGPFDILVDEEDPRIRAVTLPGLSSHAHFALGFAREALKACESYYGIDYPLPKLDLIAIPDFAYGAMENWGAITFRENRMLHYPDVMSGVGEELICEVIAHELAHQWFGNLVTPSDWEYLWLNESFATFLAYGILDEFHPEWQAWSRFSHEETNIALERDAHHETFPIEIPGDGHIAVNESTAPIIYSKGGSILRQVESYIGQDSFQKGLRHYLKAHEYGCASSHHLWEALGTVTDEPISPMMKSWIEQSGYPLVIVDGNRSRLQLTQKRFTYLPNASDQRWEVPITIAGYDQSGNRQEIKVLLSDRNMDLKLTDTFYSYKLNSGQTGFYRVLYKDELNLERLGDQAKERILLPEDRWGLQNDIFAMVRSGDTYIGKYLSFLSFYESEDAYLPLVSIFDNLFKAHLILPDPMKTKIAEMAGAHIERVLSDIGYEPRDGEPHANAGLRDLILWHGASYGTEPVTAFALDQFEALRKGNDISPDIMKSAMQTGALVGDDSVFEWLDHRFRTTASEHDRMNILSAIGCFSNPDSIEKAKQYILETVPDRNKYVPVVALAANPHASPGMWRWFVDNLDQIEQWHPIIYERAVAAIVSLSGISHEEEVRSFMTAYMAEHQDTRDVVRLSLEQLEINMLMRAA